MIPVISTIVGGCVGILVSVLTAYLTHKINQLSDKMVNERKNREEEDKARDQLTLGMARTMLLDNYEKCVNKGYYSVNEREVYHLLYIAYKMDNGNGVIGELAEKIVDLPTEPPVKKKEVK